MNRNTSVRLTIASSVAAVLLLIGVAGEQANHSSNRRAAPSWETSQIVEVTGEANQITADAPTTAQEQIVPQEAVTEDDDATKVRKATTELVKAKYPDAKIEGVFMLAFAKGNLYLAGADTQLGEGKRATIDVLVRRYTKKSGGQYFRAEGLEPERAAQMRQKADFDEDATATATATAPDNANATGWDDDDECIR